MEGWKILIVDDHKLIREGIKAYLDNEPDLVIVASATNGHEALDYLAKHPVDLVILDINMPQMGGLEATRKIKAQFPNCLVLILTMNDMALRIKQLMKAGANGYLLKNSEEREVIEAIRTVLGGEIYYSPAVSRSVMDSLIQTKNNSSIRLTAREREVMKLILADMSNQEIAEKLFISIRTVEAHKRNLQLKTDSKTIAGLIKFAYENGFAD